MSTRSKIVFSLFLIGLVIVSGLTWFTYSETSYEDCVLNKIKDAKTETAANEIKRVCKKKYEWVVVSQKSIVDFKHPLTEIDSFFDISLNEHIDSVTYKKGQGIEDKENKGWWWYEKENLQIGFNQESRVRIIVFSCLNRYSETSLHGVSCGSSEMDLTRRYKDKGEVVCHPDSPTKRTFVVSQYNVYFQMEKNQVISLILSAYPPEGVQCKK
jgi:hypothetical protein